MEIELSDDFLNYSMNDSDIKNELLQKPRIIEKKNMNIQFFNKVYGWTFTNDVRYAIQEIHNELFLVNTTTLNYDRIHTNLGNKCILTTLINNNVVYILLSNIIKGKSWILKYDINEKKNIFKKLKLTFDLSKKYLFYVLSNYLVLLSLDNFLTIYYFNVTTLTMKKDSLVKYKIHCEYSLSFEYFISVANNKCYFVKENDVKNKITLYEFNLLRPNFKYNEIKMTQSNNIIKYIMIDNNKLDIIVGNKTIIQLDTHNFSDKSTTTQIICKHNDNYDTICAQLVNDKYLINII